MPPPPSDWNKGEWGRTTRWSDFYRGWGNLCFRRKWGPRAPPHRRPTLPINLFPLLYLSPFPLSYSPCPYRSSFAVVEDENRIYIPSLVLPGKYYGRMYAPAATSYDKQNPRRRKIALTAALQLTCSNCAF